ncbi:uncharacterized protein LOC101852117 [Aplysia californica]|uniref:Uncharacterized protein LOC101852117 n=1 Tax=Aplysia californica TaxID=6500 RepID=A0ABM0K1V7_APLCA|nr:uncharacterized protein LOC101852117 [Aplysia californica]
MSNIYFPFFILMCSICIGKLTEAQRRLEPSVLAVGEQASVHVLPGRTAILQCVVRNLGTRVVIWRSSSSSGPEQMISIGEFVFIADSRFQTALGEESGGLTWSTLTIRDSQVSDSSLYTCGVSHSDTAGAQVRLVVSEGN